MKRRRILLLLALAVVVSAAGLVLFWPRGPKEPRVEGKRITVWVWEMMTNPVTRTNDNTSRTLRATATNALPFLLQQFTQPPSKWQATWNRWASALPAGDFRLEDDERRIAIAGWGLYLLGPEAAPAVPTLAGYLGEIVRGDMAATVMAAVGEQALPWLLNATASTNPVVAQHAMNGLLAMAQKSEPALQALVDLHRHTNSAVRKIAAVNLHRVLAQQHRTVPALAAALADPELEVQSLAAYSLGEMGSNARPALPALLRLMTSTNAFLALPASNAVFRIDPAALPRREP